MVSDKKPPLSVVEGQAEQASRDRIGEPHLSYLHAACQPMLTAQARLEAAQAALRETVGVISQIHGFGPGVEIDSNGYIHRQPVEETPQDPPRPGDKEPDTKGNPDA